MKKLLVGGSKSGKSLAAQRYAKEMAQQSNGVLYYVATMRPYDEEDRKRIQNHLKERDGWGFTTLEIPCAIETVLAVTQPEDVLLIDSITALLNNEMFVENEMCETCGEKIANGLQKVLQERKNVILVSDSLFTDAETYDTITERYREILGNLHCICAQFCEEVDEYVAGNEIRQKNERPIL